MADDPSVQYLLDQLDDPAVSARRMFGGHGIYRDGRMFAVVYDGVVYMKVDEQESRSSERPPFAPRKGQTVWSYRETTAEELEDRASLAALAERAQRAARGSTPSAGRKPRGSATRDA